MKTCPKCGYQNPASATFCIQCGNALPGRTKPKLARDKTPICTSCGRVSLQFEPDGSGRCRACGHEFRWDSVGHEPPKCPNCTAVALNYYRNGMVVCSQCGFMTTWRKDVRPTGEMVDAVVGNVGKMGRFWAKEIGKELKTMAKEVRSNFFGGGSPSPPSPPPPPPPAPPSSSSSSSPTTAQPRPEGDGRTTEMSHPTTTQRSTNAPSYRSAAPHGSTSRQREGASVPSPRRQPLAEAAVGFARAHLVYEIKVRNPTAIAFGDLTITPTVTGTSALLDQSQKHLAILRPDDRRTVRFTLRPGNEVGRLDITSTIRYYDTEANRYDELAIDGIGAAFVTPTLHLVEIDQNTWRSVTSELHSVSETIEEIEIDAHTLFDIVTECVRGLNMDMVFTKHSGDSRFVRAIAMFYAEDEDGARFAVQTEVIGGIKRSKLLLSAYGETEATLAGFYHALLNEVQKRLDIGKYIQETVLVQHISEYVADEKLEITDSVVQRSKLP